jgi:hypothetical protein
MVNPYFTLDFSINNPVLQSSLSPFYSINIITDGDLLKYTATLATPLLLKSYLHCDYALYNNGKKYQQFEGKFKYIC